MQNEFSVFSFLMQRIMVMAFFSTLSPLYLLAVLPASFLLYHFIRVCFINGRQCPSEQRIDGKTVVITGGNTGIGKHTALELACRGGRVIIACRDGVRGESAVSDIQKKSGNKEVFFRRLDLGSTDSIRNFCSDLLEAEPRIDILILNAGVMLTPYQLTKDGFEMQFGINHLGHFLLTHLLLDRLKESAPSRVVVVASLAHIMGKLSFTDMIWTKK